ncbi:MAG: hypothetical protein KA988_03390, partial [Longilinea sp.]|nr:hypothetical protein [Longilinea sp.]
MTNYERRARTRTTLLLIILATLPFYCIGLIVLQVGRAAQRATPTPTFTITLPPTATIPLTPTNTPWQFSSPTITLT